MARNTPGHNETNTRSSPDELTGDMTVNDVAFVLENLTFTKSGAGLLIDREVRDYLLRKIQER